MNIMKVQYFYEFTCVVEPIWEMTNLYYFAILTRWLEEWGRIYAL